MTRPAISVSFFDLRARERNRGTKEDITGVIKPYLNSYVRNLGVRVTDFVLLTSLDEDSKFGLFVL